MPRKRRRDLKLLDILPWTLLFIVGSYIAVNYALKTVNAKNKTAYVSPHKHSSSAGQHRKREPSSDTKSSERRVSQKTTPQKSQKTSPKKLESSESQKEQVETERAEKVREPQRKSEKRKTVSVNLYFCFESSDGSVFLKPVRRTISRVPSLLTETLKKLLSGPSASEKRKGFMTCVPSGTKLISCSVSKGIAVINLSSEFLYNPYGAEGYRWQLKQIVYTATQFPTVSGVVLKVNGKVVRYLGGEGVVVPYPATRNNIM